MTIFGPVFEALHQAHEQGIVHRDLKPDNIFLSRDRSGAIVPKILDFGIAKLTDARRSGTSTGQVVGTPAYMAPEQAMGRKDIGPWTDIWAMGVVLLEALTGRYPFDFSSDMAFTGILLTIVSGLPHSLAEVLPDAAPHLVLAVDRALAKEPSQRWPSMRAMRAAVEAGPLSQQQAGYERQFARAPIKPGPFPWGMVRMAGAAVVLVVAGAAAAIVAAGTRRPPDIRTSPLPPIELNTGRLRRMEVPVHGS